MPSDEEASYGPAAQEAAAQEEVPESPPKDPAPPRCARKAKAAGPEKTKTVEPDCRDKGSKAKAEPWTMEPPFGFGHRAPRPEPELFLRWVQNGIFHPRFTIHSWNYMIKKFNNMNFTSKS